jgi:hypothetical protein
MIKEGILGKFGKPTEQTPKNWREMLYDVSSTPPVSKVNLIRGKTKNFIIFELKSFSDHLRNHQHWKNPNLKRRKKIKNKKLKMMMRIKCKHHQLLMIQHWQNFQ